MAELVSVARTELVSIDSVTTHPQNPRRGDMTRIERSLREHGQYQDIVVQESSGHILVGNHRWRAAKDKLGWTHISVKFIRCSDAKALEILAMDNRSSDGGTYDDRELLTLLEIISSGDGDLTAAGYDDDDLDALLARLEDDAPLPDVPKANEQEVTTRSITLTYRLDEYNQIVMGLQHMCQRYEVQDFASAVAHMIPDLED